MILRTKAFDFDRNGYIRFYQSINLRTVLEICDNHARKNHTKKPHKYIFIPTLTN